MDKEYLQRSRAPSIVMDEVSNNNNNNNKWLKLGCTSDTPFPTTFFHMFFLAPNEL